ncbi:TetR/AcrR family transcriptional regulator [Streptacidiphilus jiangxiensis]|uniref:DNA-binding transcriptional regulator, AcrR family n=1 Tax=Streptacidiphilus jiangxiensis TaxID=235985 RepID=A0A1H7HNG7_STRJI|nr:TetR/AcrR family transcriptional regulator [Streptacidiphilus jiangxiensis]SEK51799.1 DNA-binding transcriptional regulator, AcrR family [Streptacidiphilus jiangxiensis]
MDDDARPGLRERKKQRTHAAISDAAIALFLEHGFNQVSVAQVAEAAEVSKRTLFAYFPTKEDLVVHRLADHETESARVVRAREAGTTPLAALRGHFLAGLDARDPITGLNDHPVALRLTRMINDAPTLVARMDRFKRGAELALAEALHETANLPDLTARLTAVQIVSVQWELAQENAAHMASGESADDRHAGAVADAELGFALLDRGLGSLTRGPA